MDALQVWIIVAKLMVGTAVIDGQNAYSTQMHCDSAADAFSKQHGIPRNIIGCRAIPIDPE